MIILDDTGNSLSGGRLILDCGIKGKALSKVLEPPLSNIDGAFISHEHGDHCKGVSDLIKYGIQVYSSYGSLDEMGDYIRDSGSTSAAEAFKITETENFSVMPFISFHDGKNPLNYLIRAKSSGRKIVYITDTGHINSRFAGDIDAYIIECNYIDEKLDYNIRRNPQLKILKNRLCETHLSLCKTIEFFRRQFGAYPNLSKIPKIILTHISSGNGDAVRMTREVTEAVIPFFDGFPDVCAPSDGSEIYI
jgi:phosphoribosyl 1,2-cyclic phosphodiesterase